MSWSGMDSGLARSPGWPTGAPWTPAGLGHWGCSCQEDVAPLCQIHSLPTPRQKETVTLQGLKRINLHWFISAGCMYPNQRDTHGTGNMQTKHRQKPPQAKKYCMSAGPERGKKGFSPRVSRGSQALLHLDGSLLAPKTLRECISVG